MVCTVTCNLAMASLVAQLAFPSDYNRRVWEDPSFIKWRKKDAHVSLHCHDTVEGDTPFSLSVLTFH